MRVLVLGVAPLILGYLTSWGVAWGAWFFLQPQNAERVYWQGFDPGLDMQVLVSECRGWGWTWHFYNVRVREGAAAPVDFLLSIDAAPRWSYAKWFWRYSHIVPSAVPAKSLQPEVVPTELLHSNRTPDEYRSYGWAEFSAGWPFRIAVMYNPAGEPVMYGSIAAPSWLDRVFKRTRHTSLPTWPIWSGLVANTLIYAAIWALLFLAPGFARRRLRAWRGRCLRCGYDLQHQASPGCPECGWRRGE